MAKKRTQKKSRNVVEKHLDAIKKDMVSLGKNPTGNRAQKEATIQKQRTLWVIMVVIPAIIIVFLAILLIQSQRMLDMKEEMLSMGEEIGDLRAQNAFYRRAYELTLNDVRVLAEAFGGDERYELLSEELRKTEIETVLGVSDGTIYALSNADLWNLYVEEGMVNQSCLQLIEADTIAKTTMFSLTTRGKGTFGVYVDGNFLKDVKVEEPVTSRISIELEEINYEITFILKEGKVEIEEFLFDLVEIPLSEGVFDSGKARNGYDCKELSESQLALEGNLRFFVHKQ